MRETTGNKRRRAIIRRLHGNLIYKEFNNIRCEQKSEGIQFKNVKCLGNSMEFEPYRYELIEGLLLMVSNKPVNNKLTIYHFKLYISYKLLLSLISFLIQIIYTTYKLYTSFSFIPHQLPQIHIILFTIFLTPILLYFLIILSYPSLFPIHFPR